MARAGVSRKKRRFIEQNRDMPLQELSARVELSPERVQEVLGDLRKQEGTLSAASHEQAPSPDHARERADQRTIFLMCGLLAAMFAAVVYLPALSNQFVNWDDPLILQENPRVRQLNMDSVVWMFSTYHSGNWIPLTWLSHAVDCQLWGLNPRMHHLTNVVWHALNALLVFFLTLRLLGLWRAGHRSDQGSPSAELDVNRTWRDLPVALIACGFFALHPIHVESVAWVAERKDLLCAFFFLSSLLVYLNYAAARVQRRFLLVTSLGLFALALMAKPMAVTLPVVLVLLDVWPLRRPRGDRWALMLEKMPFFVLALADGFVTIQAQAQAGAIVLTDLLSFPQRVMNAAHTIFFYLYQMIWPWDLVPMHPLVSADDIQFSLPYVLSAAGVLTVTMGAAFWAWRGRPALLACWLYYLITLLPVLGLLQVGMQSSADRYTYLPGLGPGLLLAVLVGALHERIEDRLSAGALRRIKPALISFSLVLVMLALGTRNQIAVWKDSVSLWTHCVRYYPDVLPAIHTNLGNAYMSAHKPREAEAEYRRALRLLKHAYTYDGLGRALLEQNRTDEALLAFKRATESDERYARAWRNMWFAYDRTAQPEKALDAVKKAVEIDPEFADAYVEMGISYGRMNQIEKSLEAFEKAVSLVPYDPRFLANLAIAYDRSGRTEEAIRYFNQALHHDPGMRLAHGMLAEIYRKQGQNEWALRHANAAKGGTPDRAGSE